MRGSDQNEPPPNSSFPGHQNARARARGGRWNISSVLSGHYTPRARCCTEQDAFIEFLEASTRAGARRMFAQDSSSERRAIRSRLAVQPTSACLSVCRPRASE